jgi:hypothetical protein
MASQGGRDQSEVSEMSKISLAPDASGSGIFTIASPNSNTNRTLTLPDDTGTIVTNSGNQTGSFTTLNTSGQVVFNDAGADVDFRVEGDTNDNLLFVDASANTVNINTSDTTSKVNIAVTSEGNILTSTRYQANAFGPLVNLRKSRSESLDGNTIVENGDDLGRLVFWGANGTGYNIAAEIKASVDGTPGASNDMPGRIVFLTTADGSATITERARITSDGKFFVNETAQLAGYSEQAVITANSTQVALALKSSSASVALATTTTDTNTYNAAVFCNNGNFSGALKGSISVSNSATTYNTTSDYRLKENIAPMTGALATVAQLKPCTYTWKDGSEIGQGFIAHELQAVVPDCVTGEKDATEIRQVEVSPAVPATYDEEGNELTPAVEAVYEEREVPKYQGVDTSFLVATLTAAIQELKAELDEAKARIAALEGQ